MTDKNAIAIKVAESLNDNIEASVKMREIMDKMLKPDGPMPIEVVPEVALIMMRFMNNNMAIAQLMKDMVA